MNECQTSISYQIVVYDVIYLRQGNSFIRYLKYHSFFCRTISPNKKIEEDEKSLITESEQEKSIDFPRLLKQEIEEKTTTN